ncbi:MAG TPA: PucR family transcriptional regulator [Baekduia sp.]|uniref:PucR family transcriptional regulator n=1 Tax=Baekduia sp. TaxID=2600305 RepID=UPI002D7855C6|nr:PucR family transcriptional regulator [Baekduia sp.]HET6508172.1 PucR family transcriptional regulator [Baekduia sp.]
MSAPAPRITVAAALGLPALRRGLPEVVAGAGGLARPIRWVHAGEVPNMASLLRGGELLLTTGMGIGPRAADQRRFVAALAAREVAALVIELGHTYERRLPDALVAAAEQAGLPLVELHAAVPFVAVTEAIHTEIVNRHYDLLRRAEELQTAFTEVMVDGGGIPDVLALLASAVANPVFLEAADGRLLHHAAGPSGGDPISVWTQAAGGAAGVGVVAPVAGGGRLVVLPVDAPVDAFAPLAVERAAGIVALALLRARQEEELLARGRGDLLGELMAGRLEPEAAAARARALGFADGAAAALLPIVARGGDARAVEGPGTPALIGADPAGNALLIVLALRDAGDRGATADRVADALGDDAIVAVGPAVSGWDGVGAGLREAADSAAAAVRLAPRAWHDATAMGLDRLLWRWRDRDELAEYVERTLGPVIAHDARRKHALLPTLEALCANGGRKAETARALHLNRQALYDRLKRLEDVLGRDVSDPRTLLDLQLAVQARRQLDD